MILKICGITREEDLKTCADLGVSWVGINLWHRSPRYVPYRRALKLGERARSLGLTTVALLVEPSYGFIEHLSRTKIFNLYQLYGVTLPPEGIEWIRPIPIRTQEDFVLLDTTAHYDLLDAQQPGFGGGGRAFDWGIISGKTFDRPTLIGGGITPENVHLLLRYVRPYGIDVASGVEIAPGIKDPQRIEQLVGRIVEALSNEPLKDASTPLS